MLRNFNWTYGDDLKIIHTRGREGERAVGRSIQFYLQMNNRCESIAGKSPNKSPSALTTNAV
jgi:hypothetical protein